LLAASPPQVDLVDYNFFLDETVSSSTFDLEYDSVLALLFTVLHLIIFVLVLATSSESLGSLPKAKIDTF
jgi:hypothetical protein